MYFDPPFFASEGCMYLCEIDDDILDLKYLYY